ncbi:MAG: CBS domain-containing protein [Saprospiraceae bacterium]|nr:CBS domain-containing protein [Saprospiraceae bacterium]
MILKTPVKSIMVTNLVTLNSEDSLLKAKEMFDEFGIHHIPVVDFKNLVGLLSKSDFLLYVNSSNDGKNLEVVPDQKLSFTKVKQLMVTRLGKLEEDDRIDVAIDIFLKNYFHCLPVVNGKELVGIVTPFDILKYISENLK